MSRPIGTIHGRFDSIGVGTTVTPGNGGGGGQIEEPFPPGVYAADTTLDAGLSKLSTEIVGLTNPVSLTLAVWFQINAVASHYFFVVDEVGDPLGTLGVRVGASTTSLNVNMKDSSFVTRFTLAQTGVFANGWNHLLFSVKIDEADENAGTSIYCNDTAISLSSATWSAGSNIALKLTNHQFFIWNDIAANTLFASSDCLGPYWFDINRFVDFSVESNRRKFISALKRPVGLGIYGETPFGQRPLLYFDNPYTDLALNRGTGGDFDYSSRSSGEYGTNVWTECSDNPAEGALAF